MKFVTEKAHVIGAMSLLPYQASFYRYCLNLPPRAHRTQTWLKNFQDNNTQGVISSNAYRRLTIALQYLLFRAKWKRIFSPELNEFFSFKLCFVTLTLPATQAHSDSEIKEKILKPFIQRCVRKWKMDRYIWRAEAQSNGNIHFHLTTDVFIPHRKMREDWNACCELLGYVSRFEIEHQHRNPNSTDIHSVKHVRSLVSYLAKYLGKSRNCTCIGELRLINGEQVEYLYKSDEYMKERGNKKTGRVIGHVVICGIRRINGRQWYASKSLQSLQPVKVDETCLNWDKTRETICENAKHVRRVDFEHCTNYYGEIFTLLNMS